MKMNRYLCYIWGGLLACFLVVFFSFIFLELLLPTDMLMELSRREKAANIKPDADVDAFMKARFCIQLRPADPACMN